MATDWLKLQTEYLNTNLSLGKLAEKHGVKPWRLQKLAAREGWASLRKAKALLTPATAEGYAGSCRAAMSGAERAAKLKAITDELIARLANATGELTKQAVVCKSRRKEMTYDDPQGKGKPVEETVEERAWLELLDAPVDSMGLQRLSATLKTLLEVTRADADDRQGVALVAELMKKLDDEAAQPEEANSP